MAEATKENKPNRIAKFFRDYRSEIKKITWCPFKSVKANTILVIVFVLVLAIVIGVLDLAFSSGLLALGRAIG